MTQTQQPIDERELTRLYADFDTEHLTPLWTQLDELMPMSPTPRAVPFVWKWSTLYPLAQRAGDLVPVGRGGGTPRDRAGQPRTGRRAARDPHVVGGHPVPRPARDRAEHRHSQNAFRFVVEGEGVWTVVNGDPVAMRRGDFLLTPGWHFHGHHNETDQPMAWIDGLDIPFAHYTDTGFFEYGCDGVTDESTPHVSRSERLWAHPGLRPLVGLDARSSSPIAAYRWEHTDAALREQLALEDEGYAATTEPGHAAVRYTNPTTGGDVMPTIRAEFHRLRGGAHTKARRDVGSRVFQVFDGAGHIRLGEHSHAVGRGDLVVVPSWVPWSLQADTEFDLFMFSDAPIVESLHFHRTLTSKGA